MTRVQALAQSLDATVLEDVGYRGILHNTEHGHMRYHVTTGLHKVERTNQTWRTKATIMTAAEIEVFLTETMGADQPKTILQIITDHLDGTVGENLTGGGGIIGVGEGDDLVCIRFSPIQGLDIVERALTKWVRKESIFRLPALKTIVSEKRWEQLKEIVDDRVRKHRSDRLQPDGRGSSRSSRTPQSAA